MFKIDGETFASAVKKSLAKKKPLAVGRRWGSQLDRDIDRIIAAVRQALPSVHVQQMHKTHPGDNDGLWWFSLPGIKKDIQIESSEGACPFLIESDDFSCADAKHGSTTHAVVAIIVDYLRSLTSPTQ